MDANEEFRERSKGTVATTAREDIILFVLADIGGKSPPQDMAKPSHFPYNKDLQRRLDCFVACGLFLEPCTVGEVRDVVGSDHEPIVSYRLHLRSRADAQAEEKLHGHLDSSRPSKELLRRCNRCWQPTWKVGAVIFG